MRKQASVDSTGARGNQIGGLGRRTEPVRTLCDPISSGSSAEREWVNIVGNAAYLWLRRVRGRPLSRVGPVDLAGTEKGWPHPNRAPGSLSVEDAIGCCFARQS